MDGPRIEEIGQRVFTRDIEKYTIMSGEQWRLDPGFSLCMWKAWPGFHLICNHSLYLIKLHDSDHLSQYAIKI